MKQDENKTANNALADERGPLVLLLNYLRKALAMEHLADGDAIRSAGAAVLALLPKRPEAVKELAHKKLNVFPFKDVPLCWRRAFEEACLWQLLKNLERVLGNTNGPPLARVDQQSCGITPKTVKGSYTFQTWVDESVRLCDQAIIFTGAPQRRAVIDTVLEWIEIEALELSHVAPESLLPSLQFNEEPDHQSKRRRLNSAKRDAQPVPNTFPTPLDMTTPVLCKQHEVMRQQSPSLSEFESHVRSIQKPMILADTLSHWPAIKRWKIPRYWLRQTLNGRRLVPVELGTSYTDEGWGQRIMSFEEFLREHLLQSPSPKQDGMDKESSQPHRIGYLAQHDLFAQIPALRNDISVPDYCYVDTPESSSAVISSDASNDGQASNPQLNIWLGPANTVSPAHTDPHHNILAQVFGRKYIRLFAPSQTDKLYPMTRLTGDGNESSDKEETQSKTAANDHGVDMGNTSRVNISAFVLTSDSANSGSSARETELEKFPMHESAEYVEAILEAGECLYIPKGWWHYIRSLEPSCNVSFWWD